MPLPEFMLPETHTLDPKKSVSSSRIGFVLPSGYRPEKQILTQWCWAAVTSFVARIWQGRTLAQCEVAEACARHHNLFPGETTFCPPAGQLPSASLNEPLSIQEPLSCLFPNPAASVPNYEYIRNEQIGEVIMELKSLLSGSSKVPVPIRIEWNSRDSHFVCIFAMSGVGNNTNYHLFDPARHYDSGDDGDDVYILSEADVNSFTSIDGNGDPLRGTPTTYIILRQP